MINIFCKAKNINQEADLLNLKGSINLPDLQAKACQSVDLINPSGLLNLLNFDLSKFRTGFILYANENEHII